MFLNCIDILKSDNNFDQTESDFDLIKFSCKIINGDYKDSKHDNYDA